MSRQYPRDKFGRPLRFGDYVIVDDLRIAGKICGIRKESWYRWSLELNIEHDKITSLSIDSYQCEWVTKRRRIREQKLLVMKLEDQ